ncbi:hypothetical protein QBC35DRAFT_386842 [Podospora australis]|uniref:DUF2293 domain-containing protein n=1 Tax=Podospora australis TaxID=1536484 RepID=A0AAN6WQT5_9PEZI|nr:hypothetical protein QBC35DRAFT_386842 [Podospora australis]
MNDYDEPECLMSHPLPKGYRFVKKGNVYITKNCRKQTHEAGRILFVVVDDRNRKKRLGIRCPTQIYDQVIKQHNETAPKRAAAVQRRDAAQEENFEDAILKLFPNIPKNELPLIIKHTLKKRSRRVGRSAVVQLHDRVKLAVRAYIRHIHTDYDELLQNGTDREEARQQVWGRLNEVAGQWGGRPKGGASRRARTQARRTTTTSTARRAVASKTNANITAKAARLDSPSRKTFTGRTNKKSPKMKTSPSLPHRRTRSSTTELDVDPEGSVFTRSEDMDNYDSDSSGWSNFSYT